VRPLAFASNAFKRHSLAEAIDAVAAIGYVGIELMADLHHAHPQTFSRTRRRDTRKQLTDRGLIVTNVNAFTHFVDGDTYRPTWIDLDEKRAQLRVDHTRRSIEMAAEFGATTVSIQPGGPLIGTRIRRADAMALFAERLEPCVEVARRCGVTIGVEPEPGLLIESAREYRQFKRRFFPQTPHLRMNCDVGHLFCVGEDPASVIRSMPGEVAHVHMEDIGGDRVHQHLVPGEGVIDFGDIFAALSAIDYAGHVTVELYPYLASASDVARRAFDHLSLPGSARRPTSPSARDRNPEQTRTTTPRRSSAFTSSSTSAGASTPPRRRNRPKD
jgi:sugar phosphate isomerase/epimerase